MSGYDEEALVDYLKENSDGNYQKIECIDGQVNMVATQEEIEYWKGYVEKHIDDQKAVLTGINQKYDVCCNDSYNTTGIISGYMEVGRVYTGKNILKNHWPIISIIVAILISIVITITR